MCSPMPDLDPDDYGVPAVCRRWPVCEGEHKGDSYFDIDEWRWSDSTCNWPSCAQPPETD